ncbi:MAG: EAL domain-containing protein [Betaproteobacteria bacterium]|nr:EAL domain-containing protein [Betaproteobacteria bacterium]
MAYSDIASPATDPAPGGPSAGAADPWSDAYGHAVNVLFAEADALLRSQTDAFVQAFYGQLSTAARVIPTLSYLSTAEFDELRDKQAHYFRMLMSPDLTPEAHARAASRVGRIHARVGVDLLWIMEAYTLYQNTVGALLRTRPSGPGQCNALMWAISRRLMRDQQLQAASYHELERDNARALSEIDRLVAMADRQEDLTGELMQILRGVCGLLGGMLLRPNAQGELRIEAVSPGILRTYADALTEGQYPLASTSAEHFSGHGPAGRAWRHSEIQWVENWAADVSLQPWAGIARKLGLRSAAAIPLLCETGRTTAVLVLYSNYPGHFALPLRRAFAAHLQQIVGLAALRFRNRRALPPYRERQSYQQLLDRGRVEMHYQPIVSLADGRLRKVEALARLRADDGQLVPPGKFLPAFSHGDLLRLFELGLAQVCAALARWEAEGLAIDASINFPPQGITDPAFQAVFFKILEESGLEPRRLTLELLEYEGIDDLPLRDRFLGALRARGVPLTQDDLGSGHSSLLRMDSFPFDEVKIDQGFVRAALGRPSRGLQFIRHLTSLAHELSTAVVIEGLEHPGLIEAAAILGADHGQGYGIARPMPPGDLAAWHRTFDVHVDPLCPRTSLGALAAYLLWDTQLGALGPWPRLMKQFAATPCAVTQFIASRQLEGSELDTLLARNQRFAQAGREDLRYRETRRQLLRRLEEVV